MIEEAVSARVNLEYSGGMRVGDAGETQDQDVYFKVNLMA